jgi:hypothetical protein
MSLENIKNIRPAQFKYNDERYGDTDKITLGVMAQDIEKIYPGEDYTVLHRDENGYYMVEYTQLIAPMIKAIQELAEEVEKLKEITKNDI